MRRTVGAALPVALVVVLAVAPWSGDDGHGVAGDDDRLRVVTTTPLLADLVRNVAGEDAVVTALPGGGAGEPSLRDVRDVARADVAFSSYALLDGHAATAVLDANLGDVPWVSLAETASTYAATVIPRVENPALDTVWLGLSVDAAGARGVDRASEVVLRPTGLTGPGRLTAYLTEAFGAPRVYLDSRDGFDDADAVALPSDAHTHMSWTFSEQGVYELDLTAELVPAPGDAPVPVGSTTVTFAVGVDPHGLGATDVLDGGHADVAVRLGPGDVALAADQHPADERQAHTDHTDHTDHAKHAHHPYDAHTTVVSVPAKALAPVPDGLDVADAGVEQVYQLPQAVLGRSVHGEIDPYLWQDVRNAQVYVEVITDTLVDADPARAATYRANAAAYTQTLREADAYVASTVAAIPRSQRHLLSTHDTFAYLAAAYDVDVAGFVTADPSQEASVATRRRLTETVRALDLGAVFQEVGAADQVLASVAESTGVPVCDIYSATFDRDVTTYVDLVRANADALARCLA
ncbi:anchored repeat ABC transporter, substrate-binding protein [Sanguibacter suaedae]|uniref:Anchored repeat ABC transporter, substrate-binding protein n=1 Tax=Sanguibacter suaedae TaxID=2795737 RepID=A0A934I7X0_9MICO|nr:anchored repeat ABC transporter, substrate-binding protein [Sanguibacter suaedae]MBI9113632.1 anchored repeat ABC transporter, substrate-binding protein [Sanguibacter suaedae]